MRTCGEAEEIADDLLYRTGKAMMSADFNAFRACFDIPLLMETIDGVQIIKTETAFRETYDRVRDYLCRNEIDEVIRTVVASEFFNADRIGSTHVSRMVRKDGSQFRAPYPTYSVYRRVGLEWRIFITRYAILDAPEHNAALAGHLTKDQPST